MNASVKKFNPSKEYFFEEGCHIIEISNSTDDEDVSIAQARVEVGQQTQWHHLENTIERYVILQGSGEVEIGKAKPQKLSVGDVAIIPASTQQRIKNIGDEDLIFLAICSPRFQGDHYRRGQTIDSSEPTSD
jgi:mannose-6-phosphate isomerase-like protein (cupin superfamily)